jgi:uncharacterized membrane protein YbaN (DUF454 family)
MMSTSTTGSALRSLLAALGMVFVALGVVGIFVPGLPTTVFVIAASYLFARSSPRLDAWLEGHRWLGPSLKRFKQTRGMPARSKTLALASMWTGLGVSMGALATAGLAVQITVFFAGLLGTAAILFWVRTTDGDSRSSRRSLSRQGGARAPGALTQPSPSTLCRSHVRVLLERLA